jgi:hypothetical protein
MNRGLTDDEFTALLKQTAESLEPSDPTRTYCDKHGKEPQVVRPFYMRCPRCEGDENRESGDRLSEAIRRVKASPPTKPEEERACVKRLLALGHPCPDEFLKALLERQRGGKDRGTL